VAITLRTSPGPEGSKDKQALSGARGVPYCPASQALMPVTNSAGRLTTVHGVR
jgi:hypothetical protein